MDKIDIIRNKLVLNGLNVSDFCEIINFEGSDFCVPSSRWLPICKTMVSECDTTHLFGTRTFSKCLRINTDYFSEDFDLEIPVQCPAKLKENFILVDMTDGISRFFASNIKIRLTERTFESIFEKLNLR